ncbi:A24 family peptidase [Geminicoccus roseus]|uniref:A24 family peptidase n=1 Tax=Geminicoccus roseus TaxID=404900 RepID=UPI000683F2EA|nr:prepilin peptidase [Geminicoccus roseus]
MLAVAALCSIGLLILAAWRDIAVRVIPDEISLCLAGIGLVVRASFGPEALLVSLAAALALFGLLVVLHALGLMGGGDVKLAAAVAVGLAPFDSYHFVVVTVLAGGVLSLLYLWAARRLPAPDRMRRISLIARVRDVEMKRIRRRASLPYGVAIAAGGGCILLRRLLWA